MERGKTRVETGEIAFVNRSFGNLASRIGKPGFPP